MIFAEFAAALFLILAAGCGVVSLLIEQKHLTSGEYFALSWLLGTAFVSAVLWLGGFVIHGWILQAAVAFACVSLGFIGVKRFTAFKHVSLGRIEWLLLSILALELVSIFYLSLQRTLGWDGLTVWELKARYAFLNGGSVPSDYFQDAGRWFSHPEYPLLLPLTETWFYNWFGEPNQFWIKLIFPIWYVALIVVMFAAAEQVSGNRIAAWIIAILFPLVPAVHSMPGGIAVGYADLPLAAIYTATLMYLLQFARTNCRSCGALSIALGTTLPWLKREGAILWLVITIAMAAILWTRRQKKLSILSFVPGICVIAIWQIFLTRVHALAPRDFVAIDFQTPRTNISRAPEIFRELWLNLIDRDYWSIFWLLAATAFVAICIRQRHRTAALLIWSLFAPLTLYCGTYIFSAWPDYIAHIEMSLPRLLLQLIPVAWLLIALALRSTTTPAPGPPAPPPVSQSGHETDCS